MSSLSHATGNSVRTYVTGGGYLNHKCWHLNCERLSVTQTWAYHIKLVTALNIFPHHRLLPRALRHKDIGVIPDDTEADHQVDYVSGACLTERGDGTGTEGGCGLSWPPGWGSLSASLSLPGIQVFSMGEGGRFP